LITIEEDISSLVVDVGLWSQTLNIYLNTADTVNLAVTPSMNAAFSNLIQFTPITIKVHFSSLNLLGRPIK